MKYFLLALLVSAQVFAATPFGQLQEEQKFNDYSVRIYLDKNTSSGCFEILRSGKQVYFHDGQFFGLGGVTPESVQTPARTPIKMGQSITSDKQPHLVVTGWTSGNHCCTTSYVFEIGPRFKQVAKIEALYFGTSEFRDLGGDGDLRLVTADWTFAYWNVPCSSAHCPTVILRYQDGRYVPDLELMKIPAPSQTQLEQWANSFQAKFAAPDLVNQWPAPPEMWQKMLDLIYTGNMEVGWRLLDLSWPDRGGKQGFIKAFKKQLSTSPYYAAITQSSFQLGR